MCGVDCDGLVGGIVPCHEFGLVGLQRCEGIGFLAQEGALGGALVDALYCFVYVDILLAHLEVDLPGVFVALVFFRL